MPIGQWQSDSYVTSEIISSSGHEEARAIVVEEGQNLAIGTVVGKRITSGKWVAYDYDGNASATEPVAGENIGGGTCGTVSVQDDYTLTENWTLTCTAEGAGTFSVVGSVSGNVGDATVGVEFQYPEDETYMVKFTIADGSPDFAENDSFTFSTTAAVALIASGILVEDVDASSGDEISSEYIRGDFWYDKLTGIDSQSVSDLNAKTRGSGTTKELIVP